MYIHEEELLAMKVQSKEVETLRRMWLGVAGHLPGLGMGNPGKSFLVDFENQFTSRLG